MLLVGLIRIIIFAIVLVTTNLLTELIRTFADVVQGRTGDVLTEFLNTVGKTLFELVRASTDMFESVTAKLKQVFDEALRARRKSAQYPFSLRSRLFYHVNTSDLDYTLS